MEVLQDCQTLLEEMVMEYNPRLPSFSNFSIYNVFHELGSFDDNFVHLVFSTMDIIAYQLLLNPEGLPEHLRAKPKTRKDAKGAKLVAV